MRKNLIIAFALTLSSFSYSQFRPNYDRSENRTETDDKRFSFGYFLGANVMSYKVVPKAQNTNNELSEIPEGEGVNDHGLVYLRQDSKVGFSVGLMAKMRINDYLALKSEPGVHFSQRDLYFRNAPFSGANLEPSQDEYLNDVNVKREVKSTYVEIPLLLNFHGNRWFNTRPYIQGGLGYVMNLQSNENKEGDNDVGIFRTTTSNFNWQAEIGVEIYFRRFKLTPSIKGMFFFNNELVPDKPDTSPYWAGSLNSISTRAFVFSLKFE